MARHKKGLGVKVTGMRPTRFQKREMESVRPSTVPQRGVPRPATRRKHRMMRRGT